MFEKSLGIIKEMGSKKDISFLVFALSIFILPLSINFSTFTFILALALKLLQSIFRKDKLFKTEGLKHSALIGLLFFLYIQVSSLIQLGWEVHLASFEKLYQHFSLFCLIKATSLIETNVINV